MTSDYTLSEHVDLVFETPDSHSHFFGYYDKSPFDADGRRLLSHRVDFDGRPITADDSATVGYWVLDEEEFVPLGETRAFNWQQGSMLQWRPSSSDREVIYNDRRDGSFVSVVIDIETGEERVLPKPVYAVHPSGEFALAANFERFHFCRDGYNYPGVENPKWDQPMHEDDGIYRVDLNTGAVTQIVSTESLCSVDPKPVFEKTDNWLEHMVWNPSGTRFAFFHRWNNDDGRFETRLYTSDPDGENRYRFPDTGGYSHMAWRDDDRFTIWGTKPSTHQASIRFIRDNPLLNSIIAPVFRFFRDRIVGSEMNEVLPDSGFLDYTDGESDFDQFRPGQLTWDGHPTWGPDQRWLLLDSYAEQDGRRRLYFMDDDTGTLHELAAFDSTYNDSVYRCDLHPRWDRSYDRIAVDSAHGERRQQVVLDQSLM